MLELSVLMLALVIAIGFILLMNGRCKHDWQEKEVFNILTMNNGIERLIGRKYVHECTKCKKIKSQRVDMRAY